MVDISATNTLFLLNRYDHNMNTRHKAMSIHLKLMPVVWFNYSIAFNRVTRFRIIFDFDNCNF